MRRIMLSAVFFTLFGIPQTSAPKAPFSIAVVPTTSRDESGTIEMARKTPREFFVVLTNVSHQDQLVWETWNSWGYQTISFELSTTDGRKVLVSMRNQGFTVNFPGAFLIRAGEHQVFPIRLGTEWETHPSLAMKNEMPIKLKVVYEVRPTEESAQYNVWTGRIESRAYDLTLRQW
jgi:hypothetical protein